MHTTNYRLTLSDTTHAMTRLL